MPTAIRIVEPQTLAAGLHTTATATSAPNPKRPAIRSCTMVTTPMNVVIPCALNSHTRAASPPIVVDRV